MVRHPLPSPAETLVDLSDDVPAAPFENQYHHNAARQDKIANPTEREMQQLLTKVGTAATCTALREGAAERISLNVRGLTDADCVSLGHLLKVPNRLSALTTLSLSNNAIGDLGARALGDALASPGGAPLLTRLALHENAIGDDGLAALAASFTPSGAPTAAPPPQLQPHRRRRAPRAFECVGSRRARELRELHLAANNIGDAGATAIAEQLHHVPKLTTLVYGTSVGGNHIAGPGVSALVRALRANGGRPLSTSLRSNPLTTDAMGEIQQLIRDGGVDLLHFQYDAPTTGAPRLAEANKQWRRRLLPPLHTAATRPTIFHSACLRRSETLQRASDAQTLHAHAASCTCAAMARGQGTGHTPRLRTWRPGAPTSPHSCTVSMLGMIRSLLANCEPERPPAPAGCGIRVQPYVSRALGSPVRWSTLNVGATRELSRFQSRFLNRYTHIHIFKAHSRIYDALWNCTGST